MQAAPAPDIDHDSQSYWDGLGDERIVLQQCESCARRRFPPMPSCPWCAATGYHLVDVSGRGRVYSWVTVHRALSDAQREAVPYCVAIVELDDGVRMLGKLEGHATPDAAVTPVFITHQGWTELRFRVTELA